MRKHHNTFQSNKRTLRKFKTILEIAVMTLAFYATWLVSYQAEMHPYLGYGKYILMGIYAMLTGIMFHVNDANQFGHIEMKELLSSQIISMFFVNFFTYFQLCLMAIRMLSPLPLLVLFIAEIFIAYAAIILFHAWYQKWNTPHNMLLIYGNQNGLDVKFKMDNRKDKYRIMSVVNISDGKEKILHELRKHDSVILSDVPAQTRNDIMKFCYGRNIRIYTVPKISDIIDRGASEITLFDTPLLLINTEGPTPSQKAVKRFLDILFSLIGLILTSPIWLAVAIAIKAEDKGPVFYRQKRVTKDGKTFMILKFRSMIVNAEKGGYDMSMRATGKDPRITKVGNIIRKIRIDELPQIWNILCGDMSIVGPRPERVENVEAYMQEIPEFVFRNKVKAGLTGYAQVYGKYNTSAYDKLRLDLMYIEKYSLLLDLKLCFMTVQVMFKPEATEGFEAVAEREDKKQTIFAECERNNEETAYSGNQPVLSSRTVSNQRHMSGMDQKRV